MSFGASPSDIIIVVTFCRALYRKCKSAGGEYDEISREVRGLHTVLKHLKYEVEAPESPLNRDRSLWGQQLVPIIGDCDFTLRKLDELLQKYGRLGSGGSSPSSPRVLWERMKFGSNEMDTLGEIRVKMIGHKTSLTLFLDTIQLHQSGKMSEKLDTHGGQLDIILDKVDNIAARMGQREGSIMTSYDDDDKEVWKQFRRELVAEGFSSDVLQQHKDVLRAYIRQIDQNGLLEEPRTPSPPMLNSEQWIDSVNSATSEDAPPSFSSLVTATDSGTKEMMVREDNMKFPQFMKLELRWPETHRKGLETSQPKLDARTVSTENSAVNNIQAHPIVTPVPSQLVVSDEKEVVYQNTDNSSSSDEEPDDDSSSNGVIIRTSDLLAMTRALQLHIPGSPASLQSSLGSIVDDDALISMALQPKKQVELGSSPSRPGAMAIPSNALRPSRSSFGASPRPDMMRKLAPDQHGNEISPDAKWTKINRALVSPEVLQQDGRRYEARPNFVAVLGVLSRAEIEALTARSHALRASRYRRSLVQTEKEYPPPQPLRPTPAQQPSFSFNSASQAQDGRETSSSSSHFLSSESESESESESDSDSENERRRRRRRSNPRRQDNMEENRSASRSTPIPVQGYPHAYGAPPPSMGNPRPSNSTAQQAMYMSGGLGVGDTQQPSRQPQGWSYNYNLPSQQQPNNNFENSPSHTGNWAPPLNPRPSQRSAQQYPVRNDRGSEREHIDGDKTRERERGERERGKHRRHSSNHGSSRESHHSRYSNPDQNSARGKQRRWKENLASAGIGGAAASLLHVLTEAAEAL